MLSVTVHLHTIIQLQTTEGLKNKIIISVGENTTLHYLISFLDLHLSEEAMLFVVNGKVVPPTHVIQNNDEVHLIPAISGGAYEPIRKL